MPLHIVLIIILFDILGTWFILYSLRRGKFDSGRMGMGIVYKKSQPIKFYVTLVYLFLMMIAITAVLLQQHFHIIIFK